LPDKKYEREAIHEYEVADSMDEGTGHIHIHGMLLISFYSTYLATKKGIKHPNGNYFTS
jgi:hypothetical protein